ncbi:MAG: hypothetical protein WCK35_11170 [Chloroflexota bacterium]
MADNDWMYEIISEQAPVQVDDPRTDLERILDEMDAEYSETIKSVRP